MNVWLDSPWICIRGALLFDKAAALAEKGRAATLAEEPPMSLKWLGLIPFIALLVGMPLLNHPEPFVLGLPLPLAWATFCSLLTAATLALVFVLDPANRVSKDTAPENRASENLTPEHRAP